MTDVRVLLAGPGGCCMDDAAAALSADPDVWVIARCVDRWHAAETIRALAPDVAVVDVGLVSLSEAFLAGWGPISRDTAFVVVGHEPSEVVARRLCRQGVCAYVPRSRLAAELPGAVRQAAGVPVAA